MPWTFAHPAAILPLRRFCPAPLDFSALVIGSMVPDLGYYSLLQPGAYRPQLSRQHLGLHSRRPSALDHIQPVAQAALFRASAAPPGRSCRICGDAALIASARFDCCWGLCAARCVDPHRLGLLYPQHLGGQATTAAAGISISSKQC